jgi:hypothetical protein
VRRIWIFSMMKVTYTFFSWSSSMALAATEACVRSSSLPAHGHGRC